MEAWPQPDKGQANEDVGVDATNNMSNRQTPDAHMMRLCIYVMQTMTRREMATVWLLGLRDLRNPL